jgi:hypothetical protein
MGSAFALAVSNLRATARVVISSRIQTSQSQGVNGSSRRECGLEDAFGKI